MYTVVRELPPGSTPCARAKSAADFEPASAQRAVRASGRGDFTREAMAIVKSPLSVPVTGLGREVLHPSHRRKWGVHPSPRAGALHYGRQTTEREGEASMNGAESLARTLVAGGVN